MSDYERLRSLLLAPEQAALERLRVAAATLPQRLPELLEELERGERREALHRALAPVVAAALDDAVRRDRRRIVDALFPVIGPAIRRSIAEALRGFVADLNRALEHSLTPRGIAWRIESWRSGVPFAQVVMKHSLRYRIDHLFLIERESGLLLHRHSAPDLPDLDADAIAGMLTAIADFVRDSVRADEDAGLASATVGEHLLQLVEGPSAVLACFIRGVPPAALVQRLRAALEDLHRARDAQPEPEGFDWDAAAGHAFESPLLEARARAPTAAPARWPVLLLVLALLALSAAWARDRWQRVDAAARLRAAVQASPGWEWLELERDARWRLRVLRDPDAAPVAEVLAAARLDAAAVRVEERPFLSLHAPLVARRAQRALAPPAGVELGFDAGVLRIRGRAPAEWVRGLEERARLLPGVVELDRAGLEVLPPADPRACFEELARAVQAQEIAFARGRSRLEPAAEAAARELAGRAQAAVAEAKRIGIEVRLVVHGWSDDSGRANLNARLREQRAAALREVLVRHGIDPGLIRTVADDDRKATRAGVRVEVPGDG